MMEKKQVFYRFSYFVRKKKKDLPDQKIVMQEPFILHRSVGETTVKERRVASGFGGRDGGRDIKDEMERIRERERLPVPAGTTHGLITSLHNGISSMFFFFFQKKNKLILYNISDPSSERDQHDTALPLFISGARSRSLDERLCNQGPDWSRRTS